ncbi:MAG: hypothetical protein AAFV90_30405 [Cyanobacteria bacterium J06634_5]
MIGNIAYLRSATLKEAELLSGYPDKQPYFVKKDEEVALSIEIHRY